MTTTTAADPRLASKSLAERAAKAREISAVMDGIVKRYVDEYNAAIRTQLTDYVSRNTEWASGLERFCAELDVFAAQVSREAGRLRAFKALNAHVTTEVLPMGSADYASIIGSTRNLLSLVAQNLDAASPTLISSADSATAKAAASLVRISVSGLRAMEDVAADQGAVSLNWDAFVLQLYGYARCFKESAKLLRWVLDRFRRLPQAELSQDSLHRLQQWRTDVERLALENWAAEGGRHAEEAVAA
jgi:hypothetical protein